MSTPIWNTLVPVAACVAAGGLIFNLVSGSGQGGAISVPEPPHPGPVTQVNRTYEKTAVGIISGRGSKKDWGVKAATDFNYLYTVKGTSEVIQNDGEEVRELCTYDQCMDNVVLDDVKLSMESPEELVTMCKGLTSLGELILAVSTGEPNVAGVGRFMVAAGHGGEHILQQLDGKEITVPKEIREMLGLEDWVKGKMQIMVSNRENPLFKGGKKAIITYTKGEGITKIEAVDCELTSEEEVMIRRANSALDYYVFPAEQYRKSSWSVPASAFTYLLDPYMHVSPKEVSGEVDLKQSADKSAGEHCVKIDGGALEFDRKDEKKKVHGRVSSLTGESVFSDKDGIVTSAYMKGSVEYWDCSEDHMLFEVKHEVQPTFEVEYTCKPVENK